MPPQEIKKCPKCDEHKPVDTAFGYRTVDGRVVAQSWCRACRSSAPRKRSSSAPRRGTIDQVTDAPIDDGWTPVFEPLELASTVGASSNVSVDISAMRLDISDAPIVDIQPSPFYTVMDEPLPVVSKPKRKRKPKYVIIPGNLVSLRLMYAEMFDTTGEGKSWQTMFANITQKLESEGKLYKLDATALAKTQVLTELNG